MTFEIETATTAKLLDIQVLSQKNRQPDQNPGVQLFFAMKLANHALAGFDGSLKSFLFTKNGADAPVATKRKDSATATLEGVEAVSDLPNLSKIGAKLKALSWADEITGLELNVIFATGKPFVLDDCTASRFKIAPQEGGTVLLNFLIEAPDASETIFAKLAKFKSREVEITMLQHEPAQQDLEEQEPTRGRSRPPKADAPAKPDPTAEFIARNQAAAGAH